MKSSTSHRNWPIKFLLESCFANQQDSNRTRSELNSDGPVPPNRSVIQAIHWTKKLNEFSGFQRKSLARLNQNEPERPVQTVALTERALEVSKNMRVDSDYGLGAYTCTCSVSRS